MIFQTLFFINDFSFTYIIVKTPVRSPLVRSQTAFQKGVCPPMSSKTKIIVLHMKEVVYTAVFLALALILLVVFLIMFSGKKDSAKKPSVTTAASAENARYIPGIYTSTISLGDQTFDVQVNVEQDRITAISLNNLSETTAAMYPLMEPALDSIASQIYVNQTTEGLIYGEDDRYTSELLVSAINQALEQAQNPSSSES